MSWAANGGFADKDGAGFNRESFGFDVTNHFGAGFQVDSVGGGQVAVHFAIHDNRAGFDFGFDAGIFPNGEVAAGIDFAFDFAVNNEVVAEFHGTFDFDVG